MTLLSLQETAGINLYCLPVMVLWKVVPSVSISQVTQSSSWWYLYVPLARDPVIGQALFLCNICVNLLFIHALTNATDDHKYSPLPYADFDSSEVLVSFIAFILEENVPFDFERAF